MTIQFKNARVVQTAVYITVEIQSDAFKPRDFNRSYTNLYTFPVG